ncbi:hypothetical protein [Pseudonocardia sp.]|jgi:hypothetical protein
MTVVGGGEIDGVVGIPLVRSTPGVGRDPADVECLDQTRWQ